MSDGSNPVPDTKVLDTQEFFEHMSQVNAQNAKRTFDEFQEISLTSARRSQVHFDDLNSRTLNSYDLLLTLQTKINNEHFEGLNELRQRLKTIEADRARYADDAEYVTRYDLSNPVTTGTGDAVRAAAYTPNRAVDVAAADTATANAAIAAAVADALTATIPLIVAAIVEAQKPKTT